jgi:acetyltransferase-like isoleucine patch superfamily enzyme
LKGVTRDVPDRHLAVGNPSQIRPLKNMPPAAA